MDSSLITLGAQAPDAALTLNRVALGMFFAISGYHKLFNPSRHATLKQTLQDDGVRAVPIMQWLLPAIEFSGGWALIIGLLSALAAFGLFLICAGAVVFDYGNNLRGQALKAGVTDAFDVGGFVPLFIRPLFCEGRGPLRWAALSGVSSRAFKSFVPLPAANTMIGNSTRPDPVRALITRRVMNWRIWSTVSPCLSNWRIVSGSNVDVSTTCT